MLGSTDRPFARPGDWVRLTLDPDCHRDSAGFAGPASAFAVSVIHTPPAGGPRRVVVLATDCGAVDVASCAALDEVQSAVCFTVNGPGAPVGLERLDAGTLRFRFPDTDSLIGQPDDDLTLTGPVTLAVTALGNPLPCALAAEPCAPQPGLLACVDALRTENGTCNPQPHATFSHFTALPPPNDYRAICTSPVPPCTGLVDDLRFTVDAAGNVLLPMDWRGIRVDRDAVPVARLLRASSTVEAFEGRGAPIRIADLESLGSYSPEGIKLPPLFDPQSDPTQMGAATFFGSTDAEETVLRFARHREPSNQCIGGAGAGLPCTGAGDCIGGSCSAPVCAGGSNDGAACTVDPECPGGECGAGLFDFSTRLMNDSGPVLLRLGACIGGSSALASCASNGDCPGGQCGAFTLAALDPVPLEGLNQSSVLNCFVMEEAIANPAVDMNGDGDAIDSVVKLADRSTGQVQAIGPGMSQGRAVVRVRQPPFSFPALALDGDVIAFLEPEPRQGASDGNGNGSVFDTILRAYRLGGGEVTDPMNPIAADAAPLLDERSLAVADGLVFFRSPEAAGAVQETTRVSVDSAGNQALGGEWPDAQPSLSADGRHVAFTSPATNLVPGDTNNSFDIFVHDRLTGATRRVSVSGTGEEGNGYSLFSPYLSATGRYVAFSSNAGNLVPGDTNAVGGGWPGSALDIFVHDRDADEDGVFDETGVGERATVRVSVSSDGEQADGHSFNDIGGISPDGRFVTFESEATNLVPGDGNALRDVFLHDRDADGNGVFDETAPGGRSTVRISVAADGLDASGASRNSKGSADGRFVVFESEACDLIPGDCVTTGDTNGVSDVFLRDRDVDQDGIFDEPGASTTIRVSVNASGEQGNHQSFAPHISEDGSTVTFTSLASNLVAGDTNGFRDVFTYDRVSGQVTAITLTPSGGIGNGNCGSGEATPDGRFVVFGGNARNLVPWIGGTSADLFLHDRSTSLTTMLNLTPSGGVSNDFYSPTADISADGRVVAFASAATDLVAGDTNGRIDIFVRGPAVGSGDLTGDGLADDVVLRVLDTTTGPPSAVIDLCPAQAVSIAGGRAAFLRPEAAGATPSLAVCPSGPLVDGRPDLNGDADAVDSVVHLWNGSGVDNLALAARDVTLAEGWVAALASEAAQGNADLNGDADASDDVVHVLPVGGFLWTNVGRAADSLALRGNLVAFLTPEAAQGGSDLNGDGDAVDRVVHVYDAAASMATNVGEAAEEIVVGGSGLVAFRTLESSQGGEDLNGDGDTADGVLQVYDAAGNLVLNGRQAVTPCRLEACDPRVPYRVRGDTVTFLTLEADQGEDLNHDGDLGDLVLQVLNVRQACNEGGPATACHALAAASAGICTDTGAACVDDAVCPQGECFVPPGGCLRDLGSACNPSNGSGCSGTDRFCQPILGSPGAGTCVLVESSCRSDADCNAPAFCSQGSQAFQRLMDPLGVQSGGTAIFTSSGRCTETLAGACTVSEQCEPGEYCFQGSCHRQHGTCAADADCPPSSFCRPQLVRATADDADLDELPDVIDNCPAVANIDQADLDGDGVGDACDQETCSDGVIEGAEECDDENLVSGDGCDANCRTTGCGNGVITAGEVCDDGNATDTDGCKNDCTINVCGDGVLNAGVEQCDDGNGVGTDACKNDCTINVCGDGVIRAGVETCEDGNTAAGDGCSDVCVIEPCWQCVGVPSVCASDPDDTPCDDGDACTTGDVCRAASCVHSPVTCDDGDPCTQDSCNPASGCVYDSAPRPSCDAAASLLRIRHDAADPTRDTLLWKWFRGNAPLSTFGDPTTTTDSTLCLYDQSGLVARADVPAAGTCDGAPCWTATPKGYRYRDLAAAQDGVRIVMEKAAPNAKVVVKGRGAALPDPSTAALLPPVTVQWVNDSTAACVGAEYGASAVVKQDATIFKAKQF